MFALLSKTRSARQWEPARALFVVRAEEKERRRERDGKRRERERERKKDDWSGRKKERKKERKPRGPLAYSV